MSQPCGVPGCTKPKYTPDGNKSFKCQFWRLRAQAKTEEISVQLESNSKLAAKLRSQKINMNVIYHQEIKAMPANSDHLNKIVEKYEEKEEAIIIDSPTLQTPSPLDVQQNQNQPNCSDNDLGQQYQRPEDIHVSNPPLDSLISVLSDVLQITETKSVSSEQDKIKSITKSVQDLVQENKVLLRRIKELETTIKNGGKLQTDGTNLVQVMKYSKYVKRKAINQDQSKAHYLEIRNDAAVKFLLKQYPNVFTGPQIIYGRSNWKEEWTNFKDIFKPYWLEKDRIVLVPYGSLADPGAFSDRKRYIRVKNSFNDKFEYHEDPYLWDFELSSYFEFYIMATFSQDHDYEFSNNLYQTTNDYQQIISNYKMDEKSFDHYFRNGFKLNDEFISF